MGPNPESVETVFSDFKGRYAAIVKALTTEYDDFFLQCDPEKDNLCLYGLPNEKWVVCLPADEVLPEIPEPLLGINFARDGMPQKDWLSLVAAHSDSWLQSVAFYHGARIGLNKSHRLSLFRMINDLPTISETLNGALENQTIKNSSVSDRTSSNGNSISCSKRGCSDISVIEEEEDDDDDDDDDSTCGVCGKDYSKDEFWICCDMCETWFHGKCVKITEARAAHIKKFKCQACCMARDLSRKK